MKGIKHVIHLDHTASGSYEPYEEIYRGYNYGSPNISRGKIYFCKKFPQVK